MNEPESLKETEISTSFQDMIVKLLGDIPFLQFDFLGRESLASPHAADVGYDALLRLRLPAGDVVAAVVVKSSGEVGVVRQAAFEFARWRNAFLHSSTSPTVFTPTIDSLTSSQDVFTKQLARKTFATTFASPYGLFVAPYISPKAAELCRELGIGYCDFAGNCFLSFGQVYIRRENWPNPAKRPETAASLWAPKAQRVLRVLLENPHRTWKTQSLAEEATVSAGLVSNVRRQLAQREWLADKPDGFVLTEPVELVRTWSDSAPKARGTVHSFYSLDTVPQIEAKLAHWYERHHIALALTGFSGAARLASYTRYTQVTGYIPADAAPVAFGLGLRRVESGANLRLIEPQDSGVYYRRTWHDGIPVVSATQLYLDLRASGGRGNDAAEYLLDTVIKPRWETGQ